MTENPQLSEDLHRIFINRFGHSKTPEIKARLNFFKQAHDCIKKNEMVLDVGAGDSWYKPFFDHAQYRSTDLAVGSNLTDYSNLDVISQGEHLPFTNKSFNHVLSIGTLEHIPEPEIALREIHRVLKPGGTLFILVPFSTGCHQIPYDFYRYTRFGLEYLFKKVNFTSWDIQPSNGIFWTFLGNLKRLISFVPYSFLKKPLSIFLARIIEPFAAKIDHWDTKGLWPRFWICEVKK